MKQKYRLQTVLAERHRATERAAVVVAERRKRLAEAEAVMRAAERALADCRERLRLTTARMDECGAAGTSVREMMAYRVRLADLRDQQEKLGEQLRREREAVRRAEGEVEAALRTLTEAAQEERVIEKHREGWAENLRREEMRREQKTLDEIGLVMRGRAGDS